MIWEKCKNAITLSEYAIKPF